MIEETTAKLLRLCGEAVVQRLGEGMVGYGICAGCSFEFLPNFVGY